MSLVVRLAQPEDRTVAAQVILSAYKDYSYALMNTTDEAENLRLLGELFVYAQPSSVHHSHYHVLVDETTGKVVAGLGSFTIADGAILYANLEQALPAIGVHLSEKALHALVSDVEWLSPYINKKVYYLDTLGVTPSYRGKGLAKFMLTFAKEEALRNGCEGMVLLARQDVAGFYQDYGFERRETVMIGDEEFYLMYQSLK
jgi:GNAT superfamily N-acetyltransferase